MRCAAMPRCSPATTRSRRCGGSSIRSSPAGVRTPPRRSRSTRPDLRGPRRPARCFRETSGGGDCRSTRLALMSEDVWAEHDTTPDKIEAALRDLLRARHAANRALAPARVLNLVVVVDRSWKGEIANRLEQVGRYNASRTILCAVEEDRDTLDAVAVMSYEESPGSDL